MYLIWSHRKKQWHVRGPSGEFSGYSPDVEGAGTWDERIASIQVFGALPGQNVPVHANLAWNSFVGLSADEVVEKLDSYRNF